jgi:hypothetical protein
MAVEVMEAQGALLRVSVVVEAAIPLRAEVADLMAAAHLTGAAADLTAAGMVDKHNNHEPTNRG